MYFVIGDSRRERGEYLAFAALAVLPLWLMPTDFWDGEIIDFAFRSGDFMGLEKWLFESRWSLLYYVLELIRLAQSATGIAHPVWIHGVGSIAVLGIASEVKRLSESTFALSAPATRFSAIFALFFPAWHVLASSVLLIHVLCVWWALLGFRLTRERHWLAGLPFVVASLQLNSNFAFLIGLACADVLAARWLHGAPRIQVAPVVRWSIPLVVGFVGLRVVFPAYGEYTTYNAPTLAASRLADLADYGVLLLPYVGLGGAALWASRGLAAEPRRALRDRLSLISILAAFAVVPYVAVGKPARLLDFDEWTHRNAFLLVVVHAIVLALVADAVLRPTSPTGPISRWRRLGVGICVLASAAVLYVGYSFKVAHAVYTSSIIESLARAAPPRPGAIVLQLDRPGPMPIRSYEQSAMLAKAYGRAAWVGHVPRAPGWAARLRSEAMQPAAYKAQWIFPAMTPECHTVIRVHVQRRSGWEVLSWAHLLGLTETPLVADVTPRDVRCVPIVPGGSPTP